MSRFVGSIVIALGLLLTACPQAPAPPPPPAPPEAPPAPDEAAIRAELEAQLEKIATALQSKDAPALAALFADDGTWILPNGESHQGRAAIEQAVAAFMATYESYTVSSTTIDKLVVISDDEALTFSTILYTMTAKDTPPGPRRNPFAEYWQRGADGVWRIAYEVMADGAEPAPPAAP